MRPGPDSVCQSTETATTRVFESFAIERLSEKHKVPPAYSRARGYFNRKYFGLDLFRL